MCYRFAGTERGLLAVRWVMQGCRLRVVFFRGPLAPGYYCDRRHVGYRRCVFYVANCCWTTFRTDTRAVWAVWQMCWKTSGRDTPERRRISLPARLKMISPA